MNRDIKAISAFSPILNAVDIPLMTTTVNGLLRDNSSIWRMPPSPEVDAAWDVISAEDMQLITISHEDVVKSGKDPSISVKAPLSWNLGDNMYIAQVEVFHQIHCLNELRKEIYYDYYYGQKPDELHKSHKGHCVHMILQTLMCNADAGVITHYWIHDEAYPAPKTRPFPDFNTTKKCRSFNSLMDWLNETGGVKDLARKLPIQPPENVTLLGDKGYTPIHSGHFAT